MAGTPCGDERSGADHHHHEEAEERDRGGGAHAVGDGVDRGARRVTEGAEARVGVEVVGEERAEPRGARHLQLAQLGVVHGAQGLGALAGRAEAPHVEQVREPAADRGPGPTWDDR